MDYKENEFYIFSDFLDTLNKSETKLKMLKCTDVRVIEEINEALPKKWKIALF